MKTKAIFLLTLTVSSLSVLAEGLVTQDSNNQAATYVPGISNIQNFNTTDTTAKDSSHIAANSPDSAVISLDSLAAIVEKAEATANDAQKQSEQYALGALGLALVALIVAIGALMKVHKAASTVQQLKKKGSKEQTDTKDLPQDLLRQINELRQKINNQGKRINELTNALERLPKAQTVQSPSGVQGHSQPAVTTEEKKYAWSITNNSFGPSNCSDKSNSHTMAILTCRSNGQGTFVINSAPEAQNELLYNADRGFKLIADIVRQNPSPTRIVTLSPGEIKQQNGIWQITRKAQVALE